MREQDMTSPPQLQRGDVVTHPSRPEWGRGVIKEVTFITYRGVKAQRAAVQFANKGRVVINTAVAPLALNDAGPTGEASNAPQVTSGPLLTDETMGNFTSTDANTGWLNELEQRRGQGHANLAELPESMTDPFLSLRRRLEATLESFRFTDSPRGLIDWAVAQTGQDDPLSHYTRHELEEAFARFRRQRDQHLQSLVRTIKQKGESRLLDEALNAVRHELARQALRKLMR